MPLRHILILATFCILASSARAEERIETMIVTASRVPVPLEHVAGSVSLIEQREIAASASVVIGDLLRTIPALSVSQSGGLGSATQVRSRGAEANQTLVLIDGIEVNDPALGSEFDFAHLLTRGIGRVEILRGPQSSLWGSDALGGVISVTTARPVGPLSFDASAEGGSFGTRSAGLALGAARDRYRYAINGDYVKTGGTNVARRGGEDDGYDNGTLSFTAELTPTQPLALDVAYRHVHANSEFDPAPFPDFVPQDGDRESKITQDYARATLAWNSHRWSHSLAASFLDTDNENFADGTRTTKTAGARKKLTYQLHGELGTATREHAFTFAFERETEEFRQRGAVSVFGNPNQDQEATGTAFAGEYRLQAAERWFLSLAGRYDHNDAFQNAHTWRVAAARSLNRDVRVHASVSTGIKNPTFVERFGFTPDTFIGNPALDPERSFGAEAGIRKSFREERLNTELVFFYEQLEDEINGFFFEPSLGGFTAINRDDESRRRGVELALNFEPTRALALRGGYTFVDADQPGVDGRLEREIRRPRHSGYLTCVFTTLNDRLDVFASYAHVGARKDDDFATFPATRVDLDAYALVRLATSYRVNERLALFARIENALDEHHEDVFGFETPGFGAYAGVRVTAPGR